MNLTQAGNREVLELVPARPASDGDGVRLLRVFGGENLTRFDPYLMLDEFGSYEARDYIGGFPSHPHRGFETVTYMLEGQMEHRDHMDNVGVLRPGDVQWMKAASGVIHSEMPKQESGRMRGFQLWLNLPAAEKMTPAAYKDIKAAEIPYHKLDGVTIKAIAGNFKVGGTQVTGAVTGLSTEPGYLDLDLIAGANIRIDIPDGHTALLYVYDGSLLVGGAKSEVSNGHLVRLSRKGSLSMAALEPSRALLISGKPIGERVVHYGPFVMNSHSEIEQAIKDYNAGSLTQNAQ